MLQEIVAVEAIEHARLRTVAIAAHNAVVAAEKTAHGIRSRTLLGLSKAVAKCATPFVRLSGWLAKKAA